MSRLSRKDAHSDSRPRIWAEGRQNPPFQPRAYALVSVRLARDSLSGLLARCADSANGFGQTVATGRWRVPAHRLGRTGRYLPDVATTAAMITGTAGLLRRSARAIRPETVAAAPQRASIFDAPRRATLPAAPARIRPSSRASDAADVPDDPDLAAIRALLLLPEPDPDTAPQGQASPATAPRTAPRPDAPHWRREFLADTAATGLGYGLLILALPVGLTRALIAHLDGQDLREMTDTSP